MPSENTLALIDVAMGRAPADLVIRDGIWVCVQSGELVPKTTIAVRDGRVASVGPDIAPLIGEATQVIEAKGRYLVPGLLDGHMHIESGMLTVTEFVRAVIPHGTTGMFIDPHEIANVFGLKGIRLMVDEAQRQPIHVWVQVPSCVPAAPGFETPGAVIGPHEIVEALSWDGVIGLGEVMNFPGVAAGDEDLLAKLAAARRFGKVTGGHYASPDLGPAFHGYIAGGAEDDHEGTTLDDAIARIRQGMKVMMRYGSAWHDVAAQVLAVTEKGLDPRHFILCTDDSHAATLVQDGHMDRVLRHAIAEGLDPLVAIQMATMNTAEHFGLGREIGQIAPGRCADILLVDDLQDFRAGLVLARGRVAAEDGQLRVEMPEVEYPAWATHSVHLPRPLAAEDFRLRAGEHSHAAQVICNVIGVIENQAPTRHLQVTANVNDAEVHPDLARDLAKVALVDRHHGSGTVQVGLVSGFGFKVACAAASTMAHDSHQLIIVGTEEASMAVAAETLAGVGGGQVVVKEGEVIGLVELPLGGLMSAERAEVVAVQTESILAGFQACGCRLNNPNMQLSLLALVVIPELRISDKGLVDVTRFAFLPVIEGPA
ncbi:MAG: adenine deaminase [Anaerolineales bacterium]|nr:adenine deaminase [Anaerolineales bacterium]